MRRWWDEYLEEIGEGNVEKGKRVVGDERRKRIGVDRQGLSMELVVVGSRGLNRSRTSFEADAHGSNRVVTRVS